MLQGQYASWAHFFVVAGTVWKSSIHVARFKVEVILTLLHDAQSYKLNVIHHTRDTMILNARSTRKLRFYMSPIHVNVSVFHLVMRILLISSVYLENRSVHQGIQNIVSM